MKLQLDLDNKIIRIEETVNLDKLFNQLEQILPNNQWKQFDLQPLTLTNWTTPIVIPTWVPTYPDYPWYTTVGDYPQVTSYGTYNVEFIN